MALKLNSAFICPYHNPRPQSRRPRSHRVFMASTLRPTSMFCTLDSIETGSRLCGVSVSVSDSVENLKKPFSPPREVHVQVTHSLPPQKIEVFKSMEEKCWQPQDFLPDPTEGFHEQVKELRERRERELPDDYFTMLNTLDGVRDETGASLTPWAVWTRAWTAEENRHGDLLNKYLYLSGRVDMKQIEKTIQYLIGSGMDPRTRIAPTLVSSTLHFKRGNLRLTWNTARLAKEHGDMKLAQICGTIAIDPDGTVLAFADMMRKKISMPAHLMYDGQDDNLLNTSQLWPSGGLHCQGLCGHLEFLVGRWNLEKLTGLSGEGRKAQDYVCGLAPRIRKLEERAQGRVKQATAVPFSWIFGRKMMV
ncbi:hypothetical protein AAG906_010160 [Vitis piasezkii]